MAVREKQGWKVGELARRTGLSVRTLHHYDGIGLLSPSERTPSGHRLYGPADVARLQQVLSLRQLGFPLEEIRAVLARPDTSALGIVELHLARLKGQMDAMRSLCERLEAVAERLRSAEAVSAEELFHTIEGIRMFEKYYTPEQMAQLAERREAVGEERIREVEAEWPRLMEEVRTEMERGTDPADPRVQELARRWVGLIREFTGGDPGIASAAKSMWQQEDSIHGMETAPVRQLGDYINRALAAGGQECL
jgi:DNA-binding transcriptional MerR regulator